MNRLIATAGFQLPAFAFHFIIVMIFFWIVIPVRVPEDADGSPGSPPPSARGSMTQGRDADYSLASLEMESSRPRVAREAMRLELP